MCGLKLIHVLKHLDQLKSVMRIFSFIEILFSVLDNYAKIRVGLS